MMKKKIFSCLLIVVIIVMSYFYAHIDKNVYIYDRDADTSSFYGTGILKENEEISQTFVVQENKIDGINIKVTLLGNVEDVMLHYAILDDTSQEIYRSNVSGSELENNKFNELKFSEILDVKGKAYTLILSEENSDEQNGISFYIEPGEQENQQLLVKGNSTNGVLVTRIISHRFDVETFIVVMGLIGFGVVFMKVLYKFFK